MGQPITFFGRAVHAVFPYLAAGGKIPTLRHNFVKIVHNGRAENMILPDHEFLPEHRERIIECWEYIAFLISRAKRVEIEGEEGGRRPDLMLTTDDYVFVVDVKTYAGNHPTNAKEGSRPYQQVVGSAVRMRQRMTGRVIFPRLLYFSSEYPAAFERRWFDPENNLEAPPPFR